MFRIGSHYSWPHALIATHMFKAQETVTPNPSRLGLVWSWGSASFAAQKVRVKDSPFWGVEGLRAISTTFEGLVCEILFSV